MAHHLTRSLPERARARFRTERDTESGSLILDILIGMAIFALIAIIAVSAIGQYRMRAYTQAASSDAATVATAVNAAITDNAGDSAATYPTGVLTDAQLTTLDVTRTGSGAQASVIAVAPSAVNADVFDVCVEHRGAYAIYESEAGLIESGVVADDNFGGCAAYTPAGDSGGAVACPPPLVVDLAASYFINFDYYEESVYQPGGYLEGTGTQFMSYAGLTPVLDNTKSYRVDIDWEPSGNPARRNLNLDTMRTDHDFNNSEIHTLTTLPQGGPGRRVDTVFITQPHDKWLAVGPSHASVMLELPALTKLYGITFTQIDSATGCA